MIVISELIFCCFKVIDKIIKDQILFWQGTFWRFPQGLHHVFSCNMLLLINKDKLLARFANCNPYHVSLWWHERRRRSAPSLTAFMCVCVCWLRACVAKMRILSPGIFFFIHTSCTKRFSFAVKPYDDRLFIDPYFTYTVNREQR